MCFDKNLVANNNCIKYSAASLDFSKKIIIQFTPRTLRRLVLVRAPGSLKLLLPSKAADGAFVGVSHSDTLFELAVVPILVAL